MVKIMPQIKFLSLICILCVSAFACKLSPTSENNDDPDKGKPYMGMVKMVFIDSSYQKPIALDRLRTATLIRYTKEPQDQGVTIKRWAGDTSGQYKYVEQKKRELKLADYVEGKILLKSGIYQIKHNSVSGQPPSGYYGQSRFFEINVEDEPQEVQVLLHPAI